MYLAGGLRIRLEPFGDYPTGNLTSDQETGLGNWTDDEIKRVHHARARCGTAPGCCPIRWTGHRSRTMTPDDLDGDRRLPAHGAAGA